MRSRYGSNIAFVDLMMNAMLGVTALFIITFLLIKQEDEVSPLEEPPVEILVTMTWPTEGAVANSDLDLWVAWGNDDSNAVGFRSPTREGINLERDDLGNRSDTYLRKGASQKEVIPINQETISFRRIPEDEIVINAMYYFSQEKHTPVPCTIRVIKLNPFTVIYEGTKTLQGRGDEATFVRFSVNDDGEVHNINYLPKSIVYAQSPFSNANSWGGGTPSRSSETADPNPYPSAP